MKAPEQQPKKDQDDLLIEYDIKRLLPVMLDWKPKEDITAYELAMCLPFLVTRGYVYPYNINKDETYMRHFDINDPNQKS